MCGVIGLITWKQNQSFDPYKTCRTMTHALAHRGNDGEHFFISPSHNCFLGHRRLSIIDQSNHGQQPMQSIDGRYTLSYNGEIYNFHQLKQELEQKGITFFSHSDTEVLLYGYAVWKEKVFAKLRGMFAGALWDEEEQKLIIFKDHLGIKPLYWWHAGDHFACGSELTALRKHPYILSNINKLAVNEYFRSGSIHPPMTIFENIHAVKPGHYLIISQQTIEEKEFWNINKLKTLEKNYQLGEIEETVLQHLRNSVQHHMISDIPVGTFLSGGLDSSCITALMKEQTEQTFNTFSIGFDLAGSNLDESQDAARIAAYLGTDHHHVLCTNETFINNFPTFVEHLDQPSTDGFNSYLVSQAASQAVHVALSGLGGDELFLGYRYHQELARFLPLKKKKWYPALSMLSACINRSSLLKKALYHSQYRGFERIGQGEDSAVYLNARSILFPRIFFNKPEGITNWYETYQTDFLETIFNTETDLLNGYSKAELSWYTPGTLLRDADVTGMAFTLEVRFPFLDIPLVEYMLSIPSRYKINAHETPKKLLRSVIQRLIPEHLLSQEKKGFEMPIGFWLIQYPHLYRSLQSSKLFDQQALKLLVYDFEKKPANYLPLWQALIFTEWLEKNHLTYG